MTDASLPRLSLTETRAMLLGAQGLLEPPVRPATKADVLASIQRMGVLQIDTIHVVARSPYLVLWSRLGSYEPVWLEELLAEGAIFEAWSHCACFAPTEDYRLYRRGMLEEHPRSHEWIADHPETVDAVLRRVAEMGEVRSAHFERTDGKSGGWWEWKPEKAALEALFATGRLAIARRENFQRIYALTERVMPWWNEADAASVDEVAREFALRTVRSLGVTTAAWVPDYYRTAKRGIADRLDALVDEGALLHVEVEGWPVAGYMHPNNLPLLAAIRSGARRPAVTTLLSPFDPIVWDRARALALFGFDYRIEVYTPAPKRRYGYFSLPILHQDELIGRLDAKAHRSDGVFEVRSLHLEPDIDTTDELVMALAQTLRDCATWHRTPEVRIAASNPAAIGEAVREALTQETPQLRIPRMKG